jgi:hypothetical protein
VRATVIARWDGGRVLLRTPDGESVTLEVPEERQAEVDVGLDIWIEVDDGGGVGAWGPVEEDR